MNWREKLKKALDDRGMTQYRLAKLTGITQSRISLWLNGIGEPGLKEWTGMARELDVPMAWFVDEGDSPPPEYRTPEEQMLVRVARKVGIEAIWELIASAAVGGPGLIRPTSGPLGLVREREVKPNPPPSGGGDEPKDGADGGKRGRRPKKG